VFITAVRIARLGERVAREAEWARRADTPGSGRRIPGRERRRLLSRIKADRELRAIADGSPASSSRVPKNCRPRPRRTHGRRGSRRARTMFRIRSGNDRSAGLGDAARAIRGCGSPVGRQTRAVTATVLDRGRRVQLRADYLVAAIPASTLRKVAFDTALPDLHDLAIRELPYGPATKLLVQFDRRFWRGLGRPSAYATDLDIGAVWDPTPSRRRGPASSPARGWTSAPERGGARARRHRSAPRVVAARQARPIAMTQTVWESRSVGAEATPTSTGYDGATLWLARPFNRVMFAGEHTSDRCRDIRGAVEADAARPWKSRRSRRGAGSELAVAAIAAGATIAERRSPIGSRFTLRRRRRTAVAETPALDAAFVVADCAVAISRW
jgi:hypothetical protein